MNGRSAERNGTESTTSRKTAKSVKWVHAQSLTPEQLAVIIQLAQAAVPNPENLKLDEKETEDME